MQGLKLAIMQLGIDSSNTPASKYVVMKSRICMATMMRMKIILKYFQGLQNWVKKNIFDFCKSSARSQWQFLAIFSWLWWLWMNHYNDLITKILWWGLLMIMMIWKRRKRKSDHCVGDQPAGLGVFQRLKLQLFYFSNIPMVSPFIVMIDFAIPGTVTMITMMMMMITMMLFASCRLLGGTKHGLESDKTSAL